MTANFPGPFEVRFFYETSEPTAIKDHETRLSLEMAVEAAPGDPFSMWFPLKGDGSSLDSLQVHVDAFADTWALVYDGSSTLVRAELWEYAPGTFDSIFRATYSIGVPGDAGGADVAYSQAIWTFRSELGGSMRFDLRGAAFSKGASLVYPTGITTVDAIFGYFISSDRCWKARDGGRPLSAIKFLPGENEHAFKQVNR